MKKIVYVDMDNVLVDFPSAFPKLSEEILKEYVDREDEIPDIFSMMSPMPGAIEAFNKIAEKFDTYILSTAPWENPTAWSDKLIWVKKYLGKHAYKRLILSHHKNLNRGDYLKDVANVWKKK
jgi:5'(3')-deoxyribonucleotidase